MVRHTKSRQTSEATHDEAMRIARGTQRPGQTKEQTRLIAQGIQNGIEQYKKQQSARARELDKSIKKAKQQLKPHETHASEVQEIIVYGQHWLPWLLLVLSWIAMTVCWLVYL
jgi:Flp pilus assembly protein TadB